MHLLLFFDQDDKIYDANQVNKIVSAQLPDPVLQSLFYQTITTCMLHGLCGDDKPNAPCMVNGSCSKHFPKDFHELTIYGENGYPQYCMQGQIMVKLWEKMDSYMTTDMWFHISLISLQSELIYISIFNL